MKSPPKSTLWKNLSPPNFRFHNSFWKAAMNWLVRTTPALLLICWSFSRENGASFSHLLITKHSPVICMYSKKNIYKYPWKLFVLYFGRQLVILVRIPPSKTPSNSKSICPTGPWPTITSMEKTFFAPRFRVFFLGTKTHPQAFTWKNQALLFIESRLFNDSILKNNGLWKNPDKTG